METENENMQNNSANEGTREGMSNQEGAPRRQRVRISTQHPSYGERPTFDGLSNRSERRERPSGVYHEQSRMGERPQRSYGDRPSGVYHEQSRMGERPQRPSYGERPQRSYGDRPQRSYGDRPQRSYGDRPQRPSYGDRPQRSYGDRPQRPQYNREEGFMPEGFGAGFAGNEQPHSGYNNNRGGYSNGNRGGYQSRGGYNNNRGGYNNNRGGYGNNRGGYGNSRGGYGNNRGGFDRGPRQHSSDYDPNAKYSMKKRIEYKENNIDPTQPVRLNKFLANAGVCSRREADDFIEAGVVTVNGEVVTELGTKILRTDKVMFHDQPVTLEKKVYVLLNKPKDYVTTSDDPQQRKTVMDLVKDACPERIYPVGRLDRNTTGVLLLTNDGDLASKLTHPKFLKKKVYHVYLDKNVTIHDMQQILEGIDLEDGPIKADAIDYASVEDKKQVGIEIHSGKNRIVRRIFESLGYRVIKLDRVQFAGLTKKNVRRGDWRFLTEKEVDMLRMGAFE